MIDIIEAIYHQHRQGLFTLALSITGCADAAEDAVHDAMVNLCQNSGRPGADATAYVFAAVRNAAIDQKRRRRLQTGAGMNAVSIFDAPEVSANTDPRQALDRAENSEKVETALASLSEEHREAVVMHLYTGLTLSQAAAVVGIPLQTMASRYRRALLQLREQLGALQC